MWTSADPVSVTTRLIPGSHIGLENRESLGWVQQSNPGCGTEASWGTNPLPLLLYRSFLIPSVRANQKGDWDNRINLAGTHHNVLPTSAFVLLKRGCTQRTNAGWRWFVCFWAVPYEGGWSNWKHLTYSCSLKWPLKWPVGNFEIRTSSHYVNHRNVFTWPGIQPVAPLKSRPWSSLHSQVACTAHTLYIPTVLVWFGINRLPAIFTAIFQERVSLKHRNTSKWAKNLMLKGNKNTDVCILHGEAIGRYQNEWEPGSESATQRHLGSFGGTGLAEF